MESNLNILEAKVLEAVRLIKELKGENERLSGRCQELEDQCADIEAQNSKLNHEIDNLREQAGTVEVYEEKRKQIEERVGGLLSQLEALG